jgi:UDP-N-acetylglucosamine:LPS N-acetylglucosamine transferase
MRLSQQGVPKGMAAGSRNRGPVHGGPSVRARRVLAIASGGGHWVQLRRLRPAFEGLEVAYVSVYPDYAEEVPGERFYTVSDVTRNSIINLMLLIPQFIKIILKERPDVVITTGSAPGLVGLAVAKMLARRHTIWIDSIANCERMSSSGKHARHFADQWLTQWPELSTENGPYYWGAVL